MGDEGPCAGLRAQITELECKLSQSELSNFVASQEIENLRRVSLMHRETLARLQEDNKILRERELRDQETIEGLLGEIEKKERDSREKLLELEREKKRAQDEAFEWKNNHSGASKFIDEIVAGFERKEREFREMVLMVAGQKKEGIESQALRGSEENCALDGKGKGEEIFHVKEKEKGHGSETDYDDEVPLSHFARKRLAGGSHSSKQCLVSPKPWEFASNGGKRTSSGEENVRIPSGSAMGEQKERQKVPRPRKKPKLTDLHCSASARNPGSAGFSGVLDGVIRRYRKSMGDRHSIRDFNNQKCRAYTGRTPSPEQRENAVKRALTFCKSLRSCNPSFIRSMAMSHVSGGFWFCLPANFCKEYLPANDLKMILVDERGFEYVVNYFGSKTAFSGGWRGFALAHKLEFGDTLIFELHEPARFKVYIIKANPQAPCEDS
ncbi:uncharacterized protein A4U43_C06F12430 [Asparagus officinalis]|uniref:TF-B3 domain-containing protein n=1 Tax=Asparagus officinalis TaxID=4686 RepID=A0A5P1ELE0_ASPOF|nr:uncharacterized protein LOC109844895 [Asparagus officinalis]ONK66828.1 uncharacterized protein A4U43_C06F12430 [Asparagus officinalis]